MLNAWILIYSSLIEASIFALFFSQFLLKLAFSKFFPDIDLSGFSFVFVILFIQIKNYSLKVVWTKLTSFLVKSVLNCRSLPANAGTFNMIVSLIEASIFALSFFSVSFETCTFPKFFPDIDLSASSSFCFSLYSHCCDF